MNRSTQILYQLCLLSLSIRAVISSTVTERKNERVCNFVEESSIVGLKRSDRSLAHLKTQEECSLKVKDFDPDATGCVWDNWQNYCWAAYGNSIESTQSPFDSRDWNSCLFSGQNFWPLQAADRICQENKLITEVKTQILCQELCTSDDNCIGISYAEDNRKDSEEWALNCYICYDDILTESIDFCHVGFKRRPE